MGPAAGSYQGDLRARRPGLVIATFNAKDPAVIRSLIAGAGLVPALPAAAAAQYYGYGRHDGWNDGWFGGGHMIFGPILWIVALVLVVVAAVALVRWLGAGGQGAGPQGTASKSALDILSDRYARGEIDTAEYEERKRTLTG